MRFAKLRAADVKRLRANGRRGAFQLLFSVVYGMLTLSTFRSDAFPPSIEWLGNYLHTPAMLGLVWGIPCAVGLVGAFLPRPRDKYSFAALAIAPTVWGLFYVIGMVFSPSGNSIPGMVLYWALAGAVLVVSGMNGDVDRDVREVPT